jgi:hypothetical protein
LLDDEVSEDEHDINTATPGGIISSPPQLLGFDTSSQKFDLRFLGKIYLTNIDPLIKVLHIPTSERLVKLALGSPKQTSPGVKCLITAVQFAAVTSLNEFQRQNAMGVSRESLLGTLRHQMKETLDAAKLITSHSLINLQAYVIFLVCNLRAIKNMY